jgi:DNA mismatch repair protein MutS
MHFSTDKQTLEDLNIFGKEGIYSLFNRTATRGGAAMLEEMFRHPLSDPDAINGRSRSIQYYVSTKATFPFQPDLFDIAELYLSNTDERTKLSVQEHTLGQKLSHLVAEDTAYKNIHKGVTALTEILRKTENTLRDEFSESKLSYAKVAAYDKLLRFRYREQIKKILSDIYQMDVYMTVAKVATDNQFRFATALPASMHAVRLAGVYHPLLPNAVTNTVLISADSNVLFLTGANMAGKSTFMKTLGIALFLAHMGFPVAAKEMEFSVLDGIYTTINLADNLSMGASHFYAEVLRIKKVAKELSLSKNLFIIFDELFRGTNVKDAYEATIAITAAFAKKKNCMFVVSTHIMEAGEVLKEQSDNINFVYLPTVMRGNIPVYTYTLEPGITADRHGMIIINNEGILDILKNGKHATLHHR